MVRAIASQCDLGSFPGLGVICGLSLLLVLVLALRGFSPDTLVFPSPQKPNEHLQIPGHSIWRVSPVKCILSSCYGIMCNTIIYTNFKFDVVAHFALYTCAHAVLAKGTFFLVSSGMRTSRMD